MIIRLNETKIGKDTFYNNRGFDTEDRAIVSERLPKPPENQVHAHGWDDGWFIMCSLLERTKKGYRGTVYITTVGLEWGKEVTFELSDKIKFTPLWIDIRAHEVKNEEYAYQFIIRLETNKEVVRVAGICTDYFLNTHPKYSRQLDGQPMRFRGVTNNDLGVVL